MVSYNEGIHWNYKVNKINDKIKDYHRPTQNISNKTKISFKYLCFVTSQSLAHLAISVYFLSRTPKPSGQNPFKDLANSIGKLDFYICFVSGAYVYAFPDRVNLALAGATAAVTNESYRSLTRSCGALILAISLQSFCMSEFKFIRDKKSFFLARLLVSTNNPSFKLFYKLNNLKLC